jgi:hypothetical protein
MIVHIIIGRPRRPPEDISIPLITISSAITKDIEQLFIEAKHSNATVVVLLQTEAAILSQVWEFTLIITSSS